MRDRNVPIHKNKKILISNSARAVFLGGAFLLAACSGTAETPVPAGTKSLVGYGSTCKAGIYTCQTPYQVPLGSPCSCPGLGAPSYGNVHQNNS